MQDVVILGAGGHAREVLDVFLACNSAGAEYKVLGFVDENSTMHGRLLNGYPVLGDFGCFETLDRQRVRVICGIGDPVSRRTVVRKALSLDLSFCSVVHPDAVLTPFVSIGEGTIVTAGCVLTNHIHVGNHVYLNLNCTVSHDCRIDDYCNINPGVNISGNVHLNEGCYIGTGASIIQQVTIGAWAIIGAGAVVTIDVPPNVTAVGVPAKVIKVRD